MRPLRVYLCDLTHDTIVLVSDTIPINIGFIGAHAKRVHGHDVEITLFKYPQQVIEAVRVSPPDVIALSNYSWNSRLSERVARFAKARNPATITVQGGTNLPHRPPEQLKFLIGRPDTDVFVELEAELSFTELLRRVLEFRDGGTNLFGAPIPGCLYIEPSTRDSAAPVLVKGELLGRIRNLDDIPSPYLGGFLDGFFDGRLTPFIETNRGCPFQCTFCHTGADYFQKINNFSLERVTEEIGYIAPRAASLGIVNLHIADTNFGMYERDRSICEALLKSHERCGWPRQIMSTTGKNNKERVIDITKMMGNVFSVNMSVQSMDRDVLVKIKRGNIRLDAYIQINQSLREQGRSTKGEVIIGLPGETRESFVRGLEQIIGAGVSSVVCYTLMLLHGTEFKDPAYRETFGIQGKYRMVPLDFGEYAGERVFDTEEVGIATKAMSFEDYLWIRGLCLVTEVIHNNRPFEELLRYAHALGVSRFGMIQRAYAGLDRAPAGVRECMRGFLEETEFELWDSEEALIEHYRREENYDRLARGEAGGNLIYKYKALSLSRCEPWVDFLRVLVKEIALEALPGGRAVQRAIAEIDLIASYVRNRLAGALDPDGDLAPLGMVAPIDVLGWLKSPEGTPLSTFERVEPIRYVFEYTTNQLAARTDYFKRYGTTVNALSKIMTRVSNVETLFRKVRVLGSEETDRILEADQFIRYSLAN